MPPPPPKKYIVTSLVVPHIKAPISGAMKKWMEKKNEPTWLAIEYGQSQENWQYPSDVFFLYVINWTSKVNKYNFAL